MKVSRLVTRISLMAHATVFICTCSNPFATEAFEANLFAVENKSVDTIKVACSFKYLHETATDTSRLIRPNTTLVFYRSDSFNGGPSSPQSALTAVSLLLVSDGYVYTSIGIPLSGWERKNYSDGKSKGIRYTYVYTD